MFNNIAMNDKLKVALKFVIEGKEYETYDQYKTGAELKQLGGIPLETELYLSIRKPYKDELIENDKQVDLARPETEYFFVKKKLHFTINKVAFTWYKQYIRGIQIRELGKISADDLIYLAIERPYEDELTGAVRVTSATEAKNDHLVDRIFGEDNDNNDYTTHIQIADLNSLNAVLAVMKWKKMSDFYVDLEQEHHSSYSIGVSKIFNEDVTA
jgi:hypothetical protein